MLRICPIHGEGAVFSVTSGGWHNEFRPSLPSDGPKAWLVCEECFGPVVRAQEGVRWAGWMARQAQTSCLAEKRKWGECLSEAVKERERASQREMYVVRWDGSEEMFFSDIFPPFLTGQELRDSRLLLEKMENVS